MKLLSYIDTEYTNSSRRPNTNNRYTQRINMINQANITERI